MSERQFKAILAQLKKGNSVSILRKELAEFWQRVCQSEERFSFRANSEPGDEWVKLDPA